MLPQIHLGNWRGCIQPITEQYSSKPLGVFGHQPIILKPLARGMTGVCPKCQSVPMSNYGV